MVGERNGPGGEKEKKEEGRDSGYLFRRMDREKREDELSACLGGNRGEMRGGWSLSVKETGYPGVREGQQNYNRLVSVSTFNLCYVCLLIRVASGS